MSDAQGRAVGLKEKGAGGEETEEAGKHKESWILGLSFLVAELSVYLSR